MTDRRYRRIVQTQFAIGLALALAVPTEASLQSLEAPVTLEQAARDAVAWYPSVTEAAGLLNARGEEVAFARSGYYPRISAGVGSGYDNLLRGSWRPRPEISGSQMLYDFGKVSSAVEAARAGTRLGHAQLLLAVDELVRDAGQAFIEVQRGNALHQVALDQIESVRQIGALVETRFSRGATTRSDALQAQARVEAAEAMLSQIEAGRRRWSSNLAFLLGREAPVDAVSPEIPGWLSASCATAAPDWGGVPAIRVAQARREQASAELRRSRAEGRPTLSLNGAATPDVAGPFSDRSRYNLGIGVTSSVFSGGAVRARMRGATHTLGAAEAAAVQARNLAAQRLAEARQQVDSLESLLATLASREDKMAETGRLYRLQYLEMGTRTLVDLLNAEQELHQVRFEAVNIRHDLRLLQMDCLHHSGGTRDAFGLTGTSVRGVTL